MVLTRGILLQVIPAMASYQCDDLSTSALKTLYEDIVTVANFGMSTLVDAFQLDPVIVPLTGYYDLMHIEEVQNACNVACVFQSGPCKKVGLHVDAVTIGGLHDLKFSSLDNRKCNILAPGDNCSTCNVTTGDSMFGYDLDWDLHFKDSAKLHLALVPQGIVATCGSTANDIWSGEITCQSSTADGVISGSVCAAICAASAPSKLCIACKKVTSAKFDISSFRCAYNQTGGQQIPNVEKVLDKYVMPEVNKALEKQLAAMFINFVNKIQLPFPTTCGGAIPGDVPSVVRNFVEGVEKLAAERHNTLGEREIII